MDDIHCTTATFVLSQCPVVRGEVVSGGWGIKGCVKLKNILRIKQAEFTKYLKNVEPRITFIFLSRSVYYTKMQI